VKLAVQKIIQGAQFLVTSRNPIKNGVKGVIYPLVFYWTQVETKRYNYNRCNCQIVWQKYFNGKTVEEGSYWIDNKETFCW